MSGQRRPRLVIVDAANCLYRAFFAIPPLRTSDGLPTNAAFGFVNMINKVRREEQPDYLVVVFDAPGKTFRSEVYEDYKATRDAQPEDLSAQIPVAHELAEAYALPVLEVPGVEADDVIATLVRQAPANWCVTILSTDKDLMQLVSDRVSLLDTMKDRRFDAAAVEKRFGVPPPRVLDVRALVGDPSDNIPGVRGIGEKGAAKLIEEWGDLDTLLEHLAEVRPPRARAALQAGVEQARLSRQLATLRHDVPLPVEPDGLAVHEPDPNRLRPLFERLGFTRLLEELDDSSPRPVESGGAASFAVETELLEEARSLRSLLAPLAEGEPTVLLPVAVHADSGTGVAVALGETHAAYLPLVGAEQGEPREALLEVLRSLLGADAPRAWGGRGVKELQCYLGGLGIDPAPPRFDLEVAAFLIDPSGPRSSAALASHYLGRKLPLWEDLAGRGARSISAAELVPRAVADWAGPQVCTLRELEPLLSERLAKDGLQRLFEEVEMPLTGTLARMERAGVRVDEAVLARLAEEYSRALQRIEGEIHALAGERFTINSPKQLQKILFEKLKLPVVRRTKTGYSTDEAVLEQLSAHHELPVRILAYRRLAKLKSTYIDALPPLIHPRTGRIHPTFHQTGAATGRLSASNPNVQNIPIRSEEGIRIREAFVAADGHALVSADYSQVELRILAHFSGDESLVAAFQRGEDIHRRTAAEVLGIEAEAVLPEQRDRAKAVNFGIIYGLSSFGLANQLGIATAEAQAMIERYFERYHGVRRFLDETIERARESGAVRTLLGRRRYLPDLRSRNRVLRNAAERMAVNTVIQGTAADLIKKAMVDVDRELRAGPSAARLILQVHDELVLEAPVGEVEGVVELVRTRMEAVWPLRVPLRVDVGTGRHWREAH